jgi:hypothetical protein
MNLNFDMLGSPNYMRGVYNGKSAEDPKIRNDSLVIQEKFQEYFQLKNLTYDLTPFDGLKFFN